MALGILTQALGQAPQPVGYSSMQLDLVVKGSPGCFQAGAVVSLLVSVATKFTMGNNLTSYTPQNVEELLSSK